MPLVDVRGILSYVDETGAGEPVLFLHGGMCSAEVLRPLASRLTGYAITAPERPGHGRTPDRPGAFHYADGVADTLAVMDAAGLASAHVVGFSDGGNIGLLLALEHPERVRSLVAISANLHPGDGVFRLDGEIPRAQIDRIESENAELAPPGTDAADIERRLADMWLSEPRIEPSSLSALRMPVLVVDGEHDVIDPEHTALIAASIPGAQRRTIAGATHFLVREQPDVVAGHVQRFLDAAPRA